MLNQLKLIIPKCLIGALILFLPLDGLAQTKDTLQGEILTYSMHYGWFQLGEAEIWIDPELKYVDEEPYYQIQCNFQTSGFVGFFKSINTCFESLVHTETMRPLRSFRDLNFGNSIDIRTDRFTYTDSLYVYAYVEDVDSHRYHSLDNNPPVLDFLSTYLFMRGLDLDANKELSLQTFYSNSVYFMNLSQAETDDYEWKDNTLSATKYLLEFPKNKFFKKGKKSSVILSSEDNVLLRLEIFTAYGKFHFKLEEKGRY